VAKKEGTFIPVERKPLSEKIAEHKTKILEKRKLEQAQRQQNLHNPPTISIPPNSQYLFNRQGAKVRIDFYLVALQPAQQGAVR
jgi:hypothetical protein